MQIYSCIENDYLKIKIIGELDEYSATNARDMLDDIMFNSQYARIILDLSNLTFMDSTGIGVLIGRYKKIKNENKKIYILNPNKQIEKIFTMSGLYEIMPKIG